jgi:hypothetical protein
LEILKRKITIMWWTNIRFEKNFTADLCRLLALSGCIAVSGGVEIASDRLLGLVNKGVDVSKITMVANCFSQAGIMVHAYLMYGFPTQTAQETIDALEMVRQLFENAIVQSGFWHRFALSVHSHILNNPEQYHIQLENTRAGRFANNDMKYIELNRNDHSKYAEGLRISLYNYMQGIGFDLDLQEWFDFKIPRTTINPGFVQSIVRQSGFQQIDPAKRIIWLGNLPTIGYFNSSKKGKKFEMAELHFNQTNNSFSFKLDRKVAEWLLLLLERISNLENIHHTIAKMEEDYKLHMDDHFWLFFHGKNMDVLRKNGFLII